MSRAEMAEALEEFASQVFGSRDPDAKARAVVIDIHTQGWPTELYDEPNDPPYNAVAIIEVQQPGNESEQGATFAAILREALETDRQLGGRSEAKVRVLPPDSGDLPEVRALIHIDDP